MTYEEKEEILNKLDNYEGPHDGTYYLLVRQYINIKNSPFHPVPEWLKEFSGYMTDSFFSGILIKFSRDNERVQVYNSIS